MPRDPRQNGIEPYAYRIYVVSGDPQSDNSYLHPSIKLLACELTRTQSNTDGTFAVLRMRAQIALDPEAELSFGRAG
jgi:hypothetical protein